LKIINIVDEVSTLNHGIWHAAIVNADILKSHGYSVELWFPQSTIKIPDGVDTVIVPDSKISTLKNLIQERRLNPETDIVITHGLWQFPSRWGHHLKKLGFRWVYVPQGMLEPWPLKHKWLKKKVYFTIAEKRMARQADLIRAVSRPESVNLRKFFPGIRIEFIPNGVKVPLTTARNEKRTSPGNYLFLSRLHHKKNIVALAEAWLKSSLNNKNNKQLLIAGPDQGELTKLQELIEKSSNISYLGVVNGKDKQELLENCDFFVLPSFSEGLPSALLEAMASGLVPIITAGCNLPDVFSRKLGFEVSTDRENIKLGLEKSADLSTSSLNRLKFENIEFIKEHFSVEAITAMQLTFYPRHIPYEVGF
jgi:glycosyltransferase involved in cell wall biosynthesis